MGEKYLKTKEGSIEDTVKNLQNKVLESDYQDNFKKQLEMAGKPIGHMTGAEKKEFYAKVDEACWKGYKKVGMKDKGGRQVPNCVPDKDGKIPKEKKQEEKEVKEDLVGGQKKLDKDKDGDIDGKDLAKLRSMKKEYGSVMAMKKKNEDLEEARWLVSGTMGYKGIGGADGFEVVVNANSEKDAEDKAMKELDKARAKRQIGPGGGGSLEDVEIEGAEKTTARISKPYGFRLSHFDPSMKEDKDPCWKNYEMIGMKKKDGKEVPNCVPKKEEVKEGFFNTKTFAQMAEDIKKKKSEVEPNSTPAKETPKDADALEKQLVVAQGQINLLKQKIENEKNKVVKPEPNKETGEVPLTIGVAHKLLKDKEDKKKQEVKETHMGQTAKANRHQKSAGGEKEIIKTPKNEWKTFAMMAAEIKEGKGPKNSPDGESNKKKEQEADTDTRDSKKKTMTGQVATSPEMNPRVDYKY